MTLLDVGPRNFSLDMSYGSTRGTGSASSHEVALFTADPNQGGVELGSAGGYARATLANNGTSWPSAASGGMKTSISVSFPSSTGAWSAEATWAVLIAAGGVRWDSGPLSQSVLVTEAGVVVQTRIRVFYNNEGA